MPVYKVRWAWGPPIWGWDVKGGQMRIVSVRLPRGFVFALLLGAALAPLSPDTGSVVAEPRIPHRIDTAHDLTKTAPVDSIIVVKDFH